MRTSVIIDYQNLATRGHSLFDSDLSETDRRRHINPGNFAQLLIEFRNKISQTQNYLELSEVLVFRGLPDANADPRENRSNQSEKSRWERRTDFKVTVFHRNLSYKWNELDPISGIRTRNDSDHPKFPGKTYSRREEKGIDVMCAIALLRSYRNPQIDAVILASIDADLEPALEEAKTSNPHKIIETTSWFHPTKPGGKNRIGAKLGIWNTGLPSWTFKLVLE